MNGNYTYNGRPLPGKINESSPADGQMSSQKFQFKWFTTIPKFQAGKMKAHLDLSLQSDTKFD